jgi:hypothetical protein
MDRFMRLRLKAMLLKNPTARGALLGFMLPSDAAAEEFEREAHEAAPLIFVAEEESQEPDPLAEEEPPESDYAAQEEPWAPDLLAEEEPLEADYAAMQEPPEPDIADALEPAYPDASDFPMKNPGSGIFIPENPADLSFLEGCWQNDTGMLNSESLLPIIYIYCFDANGNASIHLDEKNEAGEVAETCSAAGNAILSGAKLIIYDSGVVCSARRRYARHIIDCERDKEGSAACIVTQEGGGIPPYEARFRFI